MLSNLQVYKTLKLDNDTPTLYCSSAGLVDAVNGMFTHVVCGYGYLNLLTSRTEISACIMKSAWEIPNNTHYH